MKFDWRSSIDPGNADALQTLERKMLHYYSSNGAYYGDIDYNWHTWLNDEDMCQRDIVREVEAASSVLEIGCGKANILRCYPYFATKYTGVDFSAELIKDNQATYPKASFFMPSEIPDQKYDLVFSHFVIEHSVYPTQFLLQCLRFLKPKGKLIILCPDFIGRGGITSQRIGFSQGSGREKLRNKKFVDALVTFMDSRIIMRLLCWYWRLRSRLHPQFVINFNPTCFFDPFLPDVDAVYLTNKAEIMRFLNRELHWLDVESDVSQCAASKRLIYLKGELLRSNVRL